MNIIGKILAKAASILSSIVTTTLLWFISARIGTSDTLGTVVFWWAIIGTISVGLFLVAAILHAAFALVVKDAAK